MTQFNKLTVNNPETTTDIFCRESEFTAESCMKNAIDHQAPNKLTIEQIQSGMDDNLATVFPDKYRLRLQKQLLDTMRENEKLREALKNAIYAADNLAHDGNSSVYDAYIDAAKIPSNKESSHE